MRNASGPVTMEELRQFVMDEMGFKEFQLTQALAELPNVHETADGPFLHTDGAHGPGVYGLVDGARRGPARDSSKRDTSSADDAGSDRIVDAQFDSASSEHVASSPIAKGERRIPEATPCSDCQPARTHLLGLASGDGRAMHILDAAHSVVATCCRECKDGPPSAVDAYVVRRLLQDTDDVVVDDDRIYDLLSWRLFQSPQLVDAAEGALHRLGGEACLVEIADTIRSNNATWGAATNAQVSATLYVQKRRFELLGRAVFRLKDGSSTHPPEVPEEPGTKPSRSASQLRVAQTAEDIEFRGDD